MKINHKKVRDTDVVELHGKLVGDPKHADQFQKVIHEIINSGGTSVVIDLRRTSWANSLGIGMIIGAYTSLRNAGGTLVLAHVADRINDILTITRLAMIFKEFDSVDEAIDYLVANPEGEPETPSRARTAFTGQPGPIG